MPKTEDERLDNYKEDFGEITYQHTNITGIESAIDIIIGAMEKMVIRNS